MYRLDGHLLVYLDNTNTLKFSYNLKGKRQYPGSKPDDLGLLEARFRPASLLAKQLEKNKHFFSPLCRTFLTSSSFTPNVLTLSYRH